MYRQFYIKYAAFNRGRMFNSRPAALLIAGVAMVALAAQISVAHASVVYDLTLTATSGDTINGTGSFTINSPPLTGINQVSNY